MTILNVGYRVYRDRAEAKPLWDFPIGAPFPNAQLRPLRLTSLGEAAKPLPTGCQLRVFFDARCPYCEAAKRREAEIPGPSALPVVWIAPVDDSASAAFADGLGPRSMVRYAPQKEFAPIIVRASPIAFLVASSGIVKYISPYEGTLEEHRVLRGKC